MRRKPTGLTGQSEHALASEDPLSVLDRRCTSTLRDENGVFHIAFLFGLYFRARAVS
jgi:hypothetical protein